MYGGGIAFNHVSSFCYKKKNVSSFGNNLKIIINVNRSDANSLANI